MNYEMSNRQVTHCDGNLIIRRDTSAGRLDRTRMMGTARGDMYSMQAEGQYCNGSGSSRRRDSKIEPYVPPHRRNSYQDSTVESKQGLSRPFPQIHRSENGYDYTDSASDFSTYTYESYRNFPDRKSSYQDIINIPENNHNIVDKFLDVRKNYRSTNEIETDNQIKNSTDYSSQIAERVLELVDSHVNTDLKDVLGGMYERTYGERLPPELLNRWKFFVTLKLLPQNSLPSRKLPSSCKQVQVPQSKKVPDSLDINQLGKKFWVSIYYCGSVTELWGIIMDTNHLGEVEKLSDRMQEFYGNSKESHNAISNNSYYALWDGSWHRVQCLQCDDSSATVFFIDRGDEDIVPVDKLHTLASQFCELPAQAIKMSLMGLEVFVNFDELQPILIENLCDKSVFAEVNAVTEDRLSVQLYLENDKNGSIDVNNVIVEQMIRKLLDPKLHIGSEKMLPAHISHLEKVIYVQLGIPSFKYLNLLIQKTIEKCIGNEDCQRHVVVRHEMNKIYFVKSNKDQNWYRAKIIQFLSATEIQVFLIDVGSTTETSRENIIDLEKVHSILTKYPAQAIEVQLDQIPTLGPQMLSTLRNIMSKNKNIYLKFISAGDNNNLPTVKLMRKTDSGFMVSLNDALLILNDGVVLEESKASVDDTTNKDFNTSSAKSIRSFHSCKTGPSVPIDKVTKDFDSLSVKSWISSQNSRIESRLLTDKSTNNDFGSSLMAPTKPIDNSKVGLRLPFDKSTNKDLSPSYIEPTKPSNNSKVGLGLPFDKSTNKDSNSSSMQSIKPSDHSNVGLKLTFDKSINKDSNSSLMQPTKPSDNSNVGLKLPFDKSTNKDLSSPLMQPRKQSGNSEFELGLPYDKPEDKASSTSLYSAKSSQYSKIEAKAEVKELPRDERISQGGEIHVNMYLSSILPTPKVPEGKYFDVQVIKASDPSDFVVQLLRDKTLRFTKMISKMSEACRAYKGRPSTYETIQIGHLYACKISDNNNRDWCRVYVTAIKDEKTATVYCCDYGSYKPVDISNLVPLESSYYKLPSQAIWAELHGVRPTTKEWNIRACLKFQELAESKNFVCKLINKRTAESSPKIPVTVETIYCLELIDTTFPEEDIYLADLLCESGVAEKV